MRRLVFLLLAVLTAGCRPLWFPIPEPAAEVAAFESSIGAVDGDRLSHSWRPGCPVSVESLRLLTLSFWGFDDRPHTGELVVHADHAEPVVRVMARLFDARFPIERMELVDVYRGDDDASMAANNTSGFNCREVSRRPGVWSQHAFGSAIDINPMQNPYILRNGTVLPSGAVTDRDQAVAGLVAPDGVVVEAFAGIGWGWGGHWTGGVIDYQHFSASSR